MSLSIRVPRAMATERAGAHGLCCVRAVISPGLPPDSPFADTEEPSMKLLSYGMAVGDVSDHSAVVWVKTNGAAKVSLEYWPVTPERKSNVPVAR